MRQSLTLLFLLVPCAAAQTTWHVDVAGTPPGSGTLTSPYTSIQYAIDQPTTLDFDTLSVAAGTYFENVRLNGKSLAILGAGADATILRPAGPGRLVDLDGGVTTFRGFTVTGAYGPGPAAGIRAYLGTPLIEDCLIYGNEGHGVNWKSLAGDEGRIDRCTIADNGMQGIYDPGFELNIEHVILWSNADGSTLWPGPYAQETFDYSDIEGNPFGTGCTFNACGNFEADPLFWDPASGDYRLRPGSPCIDTGNPAGPLDPDGSRPDVGVFTFDPGYAPPTTAYCTSKVNSRGCTPSIGAVGSASASGSPFDVTCSNVLNNKTGLLFYGYTPKEVPYQGGWLCVQGPAKRTPVQGSGGNPPPDDCSGLYTFDFDARIQSGIDPGLVAGAMVYAQYWFRDPQQTGPWKTGRSDALSFGIAP